MTPSARSSAARTSCSECRAIGQPRLGCSRSRSPWPTRLVAGSAAPPAHPAARAARGRRPAHPAGRRPAGALAADRERRTRRRAGADPGGGPGRCERHARSAGRLSQQPRVRAGGQAQRSRPAPAQSGRGQDPVADLPHRKRTGQLQRKDPAGMDGARQAAGRAVHRGASHAATSSAACRSPWCR